MIRNRNFVVFDYKQSNTHTHVKQHKSNDKRVSNRNVAPTIELPVRVNGGKGRRKQQTKWKKYIKTEQYFVFRRISIKQIFCYFVADAAGHIVDGSGHEHRGTISLPVSQQTW